MCFILGNLLNKSVLSCIFSPHDDVRIHGDIEKIEKMESDDIALKIFFYLS